MSSYSRLFRSKGPLSVLLALQVSWSFLLCISSSWNVLPLPVCQTSTDVSSSSVPCSVNYLLSIRPPISLLCNFNISITLTISLLSNLNYRLLLLLLFFFFEHSITQKSESEVASLCQSLCKPMDYSLPDSVHGLFQARVLEWAAISFSRGFSQPRDQTWVSCIADRRFND